MTWRDMREVLAFGGFLAGLMVAIGLPVGCTHGTITTARDVLEVLGVSALIGSIVPTFLAPALLFRIRVAEGLVTQLILGKGCCTRPLEELREVALRRKGTFPVVLTFRDGTHMRLLGSHIAERAALVDDLRQSVPELTVHGGEWVEPGSGAAWHSRLTRPARSGSRR